MRPKPLLGPTASFLLFVLIVFGLVVVGIVKTPHKSVDCQSGQVAVVSATDGNPVCVPLR